MSSNQTNLTGSPSGAAGLGDPNRWPPQIKYIVGNEACERFSYYGMRSILALYITGTLHQTSDKATTIIHLFGFAVYFTPLLGAWVADRFWGRYKTIFYVSLFYCVGHGVLATADLFTTVDAKLLCLYSGLALIAFGSGGIKPCVSAFVGDQFRDEQAHLLEKAYGAFYFSVNFGSFFAFLVIPWIARQSGYGWAFGVPGVLMALATLIFWLGTRHYVMKPPAKDTRTAGFLTVYLAALKNFNRSNWSLNLAVLTNFLSSLALPVLAIPLMVYVSLSHGATPFAKLLGQITVGILALWYLLLLVGSLLKWTDLPDTFWSAAKVRHSDAEVDAARSVSPILSVFAWIPIFWTLFEQSSSTWVLQGKKMLPWTVFGEPGAKGSWAIGPEEMQSMNPLLVMVLIPVVTFGLYPLIEKLGVRATLLRRIAVGMCLTGASYLIVAWLQTQIVGGVMLSVMWQTVPYIVLTMAEVLVSISGLEFAFRQAAPSMKSTIMSFWLLTNAVGQLFIALVTSLGGKHGDESVSPGRFMFFALMTFVVAALFVIVSANYKGRDASPAKS